jgi:hypothetical protein
LSSQFAVTRSFFPQTVAIIVSNADQQACPAILDWNPPSAVNGEEYPKLLTISTVKDDQGNVTHYVGTHLEISERKKAEAKINELAFFDPLTGNGLTALRTRHVARTTCVSRKAQRSRQPASCQFEF